MQGEPFLQVLEAHGAADLGEDGEGVRIPFDQDLAEGDRGAFFDFDFGAIDHGVTFLLTALLVQHRDGAGAVHHHQVAHLAADSLQADEAHRAAALGFQARLLGDARRRAADVEGAHGELRAGLADGLRGDDAGGFAQLHHASGSEITPVAHDADPAFGFAGKHGADLHPLDAGGLNGIGQLFGDLVVDVNDDAAFVILDLLQRDAADNAVA